MESTQTKGRALQCKRSRFNLREPLHPRSSERAPHHHHPGGSALPGSAEMLRKQVPGWTGEP